MNSRGGLCGRRGISGSPPSPAVARLLVTGLTAMVAHRWHGLSHGVADNARAAGRRWLAEAESVLWEMAITQRTTAIRSHLLSGPRAGGDDVGSTEGLRRVRPGPRHPR